MAGHARSAYIVRDEKDFLLFERGIKPNKRLTAEEVFSLQRENKTFPFAYIFGKQAEISLPPVKALEALGEAIAVKPYEPGESDIPAGYTYLGQFIFHDITFMSSSTKPVSKRTPALDLDSVLPFDGLSTPQTGCAGSGPLATGCTSGSLVLAEDLPRKQSSAQKGEPLIEDRRNDDFFPLGQCHVALLKFFNAIAKNEGYPAKVPKPDKKWWRKVRAIWLQHFQSVVLHDYLARVIDPWTYNDVKNNGRRIVRPNPLSTDPVWLPIEFGGAVGRFGHSMIRDGYLPWNKIEQFSPVTVAEFMNYSYANSGDKLASSDHRLPVNWIHNWFQLLDFSSTFFGKLAVKPTRAALIDTNLAPLLMALPHCLFDDVCDALAPQKPPFGLPTETMKRGWELGLATAQQAIAAANAALLTPISFLAPSEIPGTDPGIASAFAKFPELSTATPLWFYVLREAEHFGGGNRLGPLGGRIVMETLHAAIEASPNSILADPGWRPTLPSVNGNFFTMPDLVAFAGKPDPLA